jgi:hypothetical protein
MRPQQAVLVTMATISTPTKVVDNQPQQYPFSYPSPSSHPGRPFDIPLSHDDYNVLFLYSAPGHALWPGLRHV